MLSVIGIVYGNVSGRLSVSIGKSVLVNVMRYTLFSQHVASVLYQMSA